MLLFRPQGLTGGREFSLAFLGRIGGRGSGRGNVGHGSGAAASLGGAAPPSQDSESPATPPSAGPSTSQLHDLEPR
jgi:hypothetical protein